MEFIVMPQEEINGAIDCGGIYYPGCPTYCGSLQCGTRVIEY